MLFLGFFRIFCVFFAFCYFLTFFTICPFSSQFIEFLDRENEDRVSGKEYRGQMRETMSIVEELQKDLLLKANIKDVCTLLDTKSSILLLKILLIF